MKISNIYTVVGPISGDPPTHPWGMECMSPSSIIFVANPSVTFGAWKILFINVCMLLGRGSDLI